MPQDNAIFFPLTHPVCIWTNDLIYLQPRNRRKFYSQVTAILSLQLNTLRPTREAGNALGMYVILLQDFKDINRSFRFSPYRSCLSCII